VKISLDWIGDFVDLEGLSPEVIADRLTLSTAEVEGLEVIRRAVLGVVVGKVVEAKPIGNGQQSLWLVSVDCGGRHYQSVCGAPNVRVGLLSPFAPAGVQLAEGQRIEEGEVAGHKSQGVLCSAKELGMSRWHEVVLECPESIAPGTPLAELIPAEDVVLEIDNKSLTHRPDLWGHYAFARELAAIFARPLRPLPVADLSRYDSLPAYPLEVADPEGCPCYACLEFKVRAGQPAPLVMQRRLHALGQRTYNLMVDVTNYVMWELGQPTHAFDGDLVRAIRVAPMGREGTFVTLDGQQRQMLPDDLLIWNEREPVALAGVMGGLNSEVQPHTSKVLLESANFSASRIRRTSVRLDLRTESAQRFEKSQPPANVELGIARILYLVQQAGAEPEVTSRFTVRGDLKKQFRPIELPPGYLQKKAGAPIPNKRAVEILRSLGFKAEVKNDGGLSVGIPPHRSEKDISIAPDIVEEILRIYGYNNIEPKMPEFPLKPLYVNKPLRLEHKVRRVLAGAHRFIEVQNYAWLDDRWLERLGFEPADPLRLRNPITQQTSRLRTVLLPNLLALVEKNRVHHEWFRIFEIGRVYRAGEDGHSVETNHLAAVSFDESRRRSLEDHFLAIKGALEDVAASLQCSGFGFRRIGQGAAPWESPGDWMAITCGSAVIGGLGVLTGKLLEAVAPEGGQVVWFELDLDQLSGSIYPEVRYVAPPPFPGSRQDFTLLWDADAGFAALEERLSRFSHPLVLRREFLYVYKGKGLPEGKAAYSYRYWIGLRERTITSEQIEQFRQALLDFLAGERIPLR